MQYSINETLCDSIFSHSAWSQIPGCFLERVGENFRVRWKMTFKKFIWTIAISVLLLNFN